MKNTFCIFFLFRLELLGDHCVPLDNGLNSVLLTRTGQYVQEEVTEDRVMYIF